jgi:phosphoribosyl 1,2-cyclic phosphodiesterase
MNKIRFCPFASGSSGNCVYVGLNDRHYLIDAGISGKRVQKAMALHGIPTIHGIFITHEHSDHIARVCHAFDVALFFASRHHRAHAGGADSVR